MSVSDHELMLDNFLLTSSVLGLREVHGLRLLEEFRNDLNEDDGFLILAPSEWLLAANN